MRFFEVQKTLDFLSSKSKLIRSNNPKIDEWVGKYLNECKLNGNEINILTQWCISKDLEERFKKQGNKFIPTKNEIKLFELELPKIISFFIGNGFQLNWWFTFNRSYLDSGRISKELEDQYKNMIIRLGNKFFLTDNILFLDWEDDVLNCRSVPNENVLKNLQQYIKNGAFQLELERHSKWAREEAGLMQSNEELEDDVKFQISCEIEEGRFLLSEESPLSNGNFILIPLESSERYDFFTTISKDFKKRIVTALSFYPWRI